MQLGGAVMPSSAVDKSSLHRSSLGTWRQGAEMPWAQTSGYTPACSAMGSGCRGGRSAGCPLQSRPLHLGPAVSSLPSAVGNLPPPPLGLLRKLLSLSPQVIFRHVALRSWALLGEGGMGPINPILPVEGRLGDRFDEQEVPADPKVASERVVAEQFSERRFRN